MYFDTAYVAKLYVVEPDSGPVRELAHSTSEIVSSAHGRVELAYMFHRKLRERAIDRSDFQHYWAQVEVDERAGLLRWLMLNEATLHACARSALTLPLSNFVRAADALHLTCAKEHGFRTIHSNDQHLLAAAKHFGLKGKNVIG